MQKPVNSVKISIFLLGSIYQCSSMPPQNLTCSRNRFAPCESSTERENRFVFHSFFQFTQEMRVHMRCHHSACGVECERKNISIDRALHLCVHCIHRAVAATAQWLCRIYCALIWIHSIYVYLLSFNTKMTPKYDFWKSEICWFRIGWFG